MSKINLSLLVLRSNNLEAMRSFYEALGLQFRKERHGNGPDHLSAVLSHGVLEIYPIMNALPTTGVRIGLTVLSVFAAMKALKGLNAKIIADPVEIDGELLAIVEDPAGHKIELSQVL